MLKQDAPLAIARQSVSETEQGLVGERVDDVLVPLRTGERHEQGHAEHLRSSMQRRRHQRSAGAVERPAFPPRKAALDLGIHIGQQLLCFALVDRDPHQPGGAPGDG